MLNEETTSEIINLILKEEILLQLKIGNGVLWL